MTKTKIKAGTVFQSLWVNDVKILFSKGQIKSNSIRLDALIDSEFLMLLSRWKLSSGEAGKKEDSKTLFDNFNLEFNYFLSCLILNLVV